MAKLQYKSISRRTVEALSVAKDTVFWDNELTGFVMYERLIPLIPAFLDAVFSVDRCLMFSYCSDMASRWKQDRPMSRAAFEARFPDEAACARHLAAMRWPDGFVCPPAAMTEAGN